MRDNSAVLLAAYRSCTRALQAGQTITPATEWLLDNYDLVERQLQQIARDLPPGFYRQLPKLATGPFAGCPRVLGIAWAYVAHTDSLPNGPVLARFVRAFQTVEPLTIGELWAGVITLRIVLIENMRRLAEPITEGQDIRRAADDLVDPVLRAGAMGTPLSPDPGFAALAEATRALDGAPISEILAARIARRLRGVDTAETPLHGWLQDCLRRQARPWTMWCCTPSSDRAQRTSRCATSSPACG